MPHQIETERLILRPFTPSDIDEAFLVFESHPDVWKYDPGRARTYDQRAALITKYAAGNEPGGQGTLAITLKDSGQMIGYVGLQLYILPGVPFSTPEVELYYKLGREWWGQGYAFEACDAMLDFAFNTMRLRRVVTITQKDNDRSIRLLTRLGMKIAPAPAPWEGDVTATLENPAEVLK